MLIYEYKLDGKKAQYTALGEAIRVAQFIRNKCLRLWMDERGAACLRNRRRARTARKPDRNWQRRI